MEDTETSSSAIIDTVSLLTQLNEAEGHKAQTTMTDVEAGFYQQLVDRYQTYAKASNIYIDRLLSDKSKVMSPQEILDCWFNGPLHKLWCEFHRNDERVIAYKKVYDDYIREQRTNYDINEYRKWVIAHNEHLSVANTNDWKAINQANMEQKGYDGPDLNEMIVVPQPLENEPDLQGTKFDYEHCVPFQLIKEDVIRATNEAIQVRLNSQTKSSSVKRVREVIDSEMDVA